MATAPINHLCFLYAKGERVPVLCVLPMLISHTAQDMEGVSVDQNNTGSGGHGNMSEPTIKK